MAMAVASLYSLQSKELPATTVGEWWRRRSLRRHKGRTMDCLLTLRPPSTVVGWLSSTLAKYATRTRCDFGGHGSLLRKWSAP